MGGHRSSSLCAVDKNTAVTNGKFRHYSKDRSVTPRGGGPKTPPEKRKPSYSVSRSESTPSPRSRSYSSDCRRRHHYESPTRMRDYYCDKYRSREKPKPNRCIGVFGLSVFTTQHKIRDIFDKFGPIERIQMVVDQQTGRSRGFCFIYYDNLSDAKAAKEECCGIEVDDRRIRVDFSITQRPHTPTPGIYMGHTTRLERALPCSRSHVHRVRERYCHEHLRHHKRYRSRSVTPIKTSSRCSRTHYHKRRKVYYSPSRSRSRSRSRSPITRRSRYY